MRKNKENKKMSLEEAITLFRNNMKTYKEDLDLGWDEEDSKDVVDKMNDINDYVKNNYGVVFSTDVEDWDFVE